MSNKIKDGFLPSKCPNCKSENLEYGDFENFKEHGISQIVDCSDCDSTFCEYFKSVAWVKV